MNITPMQMYWLVKLDDLRCAVYCILGFLVVWLFVLGVAAFIAFMYTLDEDPSTKEEMQRRIKKWLLPCCIPAVSLALVLRLTGAFIPSTKQMAAIAVVPKIANSEKVQMTGNKLYELAVEWMDELRPAKEEKTK